MNARRLLSALMLALVGSALFTFWLSRRFAKPAPAPVAHQLQYVALVKPADAGESLQKPALKLVDWPSAAPIAGAFTKIDDVAGRTLMYPVSDGEPITEHQLSAVGAPSGLSQRIPDGMRAISLKTDQIVGVAGFMEPGTRVDVLVTYHQQPENIAVTTTVLQDAQILTAGQKMQPDPEGKATPVDVVTLLVNPMDAERVVLASALGSVHFVLRNGSDHARVDGATADMSQFGGAPPTKHAVPRGPKSLINATQVAKPYTVLTVAGDKQTSEIFQ